MDRLPDTELMINTFPKIHLNKRLVPIHGISAIFTKSNNKLYFQPQIFLYNIDYETRAKIYEFRTVSSYEWDEMLKPDSGDFITRAVALINSAKNDFNWYIKGNDSFLTMDKFYPKDITSEDSEKHISFAYMRYVLGIK